MRRRRWREIALWFPGQRTLVAADALGTAQYMRAPGDRLAVHPLLRLTPPRRAFARLDREHVLVGHGPGVHEDAAGALREALATSRRRIPSWIAADARVHGPFARRR